DGERREALGLHGPGLAVHLLEPADRVHAPTLWRRAVTRRPLAFGLRARARDLAASFFGGSFFFAPFFFSSSLGAEAPDAAVAGPGAPGVPPGFLPANDSHGTFTPVRFSTRWATSIA